MTQNKPNNFNYPSHYADVFGSKMHYVETGEGDPILFLHGQPTWSYLWRNIMPHLEGQGRLIAVDLIGYGLSDKPDLDYEMSDHIKYIDKFIEQLGLKNITLVIHDWGSFFGFNYAMHHAENIRGVAFMEAILFPVPGYDSFDEQTHNFFKTLRSSQETAEHMMVDQNLFIEAVLPGLIVRELTEDEQNAYRQPWSDPDARKILCKFPQNLCIAGEPENINDIQQDYMTWLQESEIPKLLLHSDPGCLIPKAMADWCKDNLPNCDTVFVGDGLHYIQEDSPDKIGKTISNWLRRI
jgi:haloalkane dehalogenase